MNKNKKSLPGFTIEQIILHGMNKENDKPQLRSSLLPLNDLGKEFVAHHIALSFGDGNLANFSESSENIVENFVGTIFRDPDQFISTSQALTELFFAAIKSDNRISSGAFLIVLFRHSDSVFPHLALLKMEETAFHTYDSELDLSYVERGLPVLNERRKSPLDKAAFIIPIDENGNYNLKVLDRRSTSYFKNFLKFEFQVNDAKKTADFNRLTETWLRENQSKIPHSNFEFEMRVLKYKWLREKTTIELDDFAVELFTEDNLELADEFLQFFKENGFEDASFDVQRNRSRQPQRWKLSFGEDLIEIRGDALVLERVLKIRQRENSEISENAGYQISFNEYPDKWEEVENSP